MQVNTSQDGLFELLNNSKPNALSNLAVKIQNEFKCQQCDSLSLKETKQSSKNKTPENKIKSAFLATGLPRGINNYGDDNIGPSSSFNRQSLPRSK
eukprot:scaffold249550_cov25-Prasinocladus_malaysianus.AAC.2